MNDRMEPYSPPKFSVAMDALKEFKLPDAIRSLSHSEAAVGPCRRVVHGTIYEPRAYEPNYAYPLLVWFHDAGANETEMPHWVQQISRRNYIGLGLRGPLHDGGVFGDRRRWSHGATHLNWLETDLSAALQDVRSQFNFHPERICVAGYGQGGTVALQLMLRRPEWFAAAISISGPLNRHCRFDRFGAYGGTPIYLADVGYVEDPRMSRSARLLHASGFDVTTTVVDYTPDDIRQLQQALDVWLLPRLCPTAIV